MTHIVALLSRYVFWLDEQCYAIITVVAEMVGPPRFLTSPSTWILRKKYGKYELRCVFTSFYHKTALCPSY